MALAECLIEKGSVDEAEELIGKIEKVVKAQQPTDELYKIDADGDGDDGDEADTFEKRHRFEAIVDRISREEKVPKTVAMTRARRRHPELYVSYQEHTGVAKSYDAIVAAEIRKGCSPVVAAQRVALLHPIAAQDKFAKSADEVDEELVDAYRPNMVVIVLSRCRRYANGTPTPSIDNGALSAMRSLRCSSW
jgi:hypothetical protein